MLYQDVKSFILAMKDFAAKNETYFVVSDEPKQLWMGFEAITNDGSVKFHLPIGKCRVSSDFLDEEKEVVKKYHALKVELNEAEKEYVKVFTGQKG